MTPLSKKITTSNPGLSSLKMKAAANQAKRQAELLRLSKISVKLLEGPFNHLPAAWDEQDNTKKKVKKAKKAKGNLPLFPKIILTAEQFTVIAKLIRSQEPIKSAVEYVLVHEQSITEAMRSMDRRGYALTIQSIANAVKRFKAAHVAICEGYSPQKNERLALNES